MMMLALAFALNPAPKTLAFENVVIAASQPTPVGCGIRRTWGAVDFIHDGVTSRAYVACGTADKMPQVGARCAITVSVTAIDGSVVGGPNPTQGAYAVDDMQCRAPEPTGGKPTTFTGVPVEMRGVRLLRWGVEPMAGSGVIWFVRRLTIADPSGAEYTLYQTYFGKGDVPAPGSRCDLTHVHLTLKGLNAISGENESLTEFDSVERLACHSS